MKLKIQLVQTIAGAAAIAALVISAVGLSRMQSSIGDLSETKRNGPFFLATQLEFELLRFTDTTAAFLSPETGMEASDLRLRFDILWSRTDLAIRGHGGADPQGGTSKEIITALKDDLVTWDSAVQGLSEGDIETARQVYETFAAYHLPLHDYTLAVKDEQAEKDTSARQKLIGLSQVTIALALMIGACCLIIALIFFVQMRRIARVSDENQALLVKSQDAYKAKSQFLATVSHELRTPLTSIKGCLTLLNSTKVKVPPERQQELTGIGLRNAKQLQDLIDDILFAEKSEFGKLRYEFREVDLCELVRDSVEAHRNYGKKIDVNLELPEDGEPLLSVGDPKRLRQLISNILSNAIKFSSAGSDVLVRASRTDRIVISVADKGIGIPKEFHEAVFERFSQADGSASRSHEGTGLGMSIAKEICEAHEGRIYFESTVGEGTTFFVELPLKVSDAKPAPSGSSAEQRAA